MQDRVTLFDRKDWTSEAADIWFGERYGIVRHADLKEFGNAEARAAEAAAYHSDKVIMQLDRYLCRNVAYKKSNDTWGNCLLARKTSASFHIMTSAMKGTSEISYQPFMDVDDIVLGTIEDRDGELVIAAAGTERHSLEVAVRQLTDEGMRALKEIEGIQDEGNPSYLRVDAIWNDPALCPKLDIYGRGIEIDAPREEAMEPDVPER